MDENDLRIIEKEFIAETGELLEQLETSLLALEERPEDESLIQEAFRCAHTLKGAAAVVGHRGFVQFAHLMESVLDRVRKHALAVDEQVTAHLLQAVDVLRRITPLITASEQELLSQTAAVAFRLEAHAAAEATGAAAAPEVGGALSTASLGAATRSQTLRVDLAKLDRLLTLAGELAVAHGRVAAAREGEGALDGFRELGGLVSDLQGLTMQLRMVPNGPTFRQFARAVREAAATYGKQAQLAIEGADCELDASMVERLREPLVHLVRNAVAHGIERPDARVKLGKPAFGTVLLSAAHEGRTLAIRVSDDGAGFDLARITERARVLGVPRVDELTAEQRLALAFRPGFSTATEVTEVAGRGVGMDVVHRDVEAMRGVVTIDSQPGRGSAVTLRVPLTLAVIQGFVVRVEGGRYILPMETVVECIELPREASAAARAEGVLSLRGEPLPFVALRSALGLGGVPPRRQSIVVVHHEQLSAGLAVDALEGEAQVVIKPLGPTLQGTEDVTGSAILGNGSIALILDVAGLLRRASGQDGGVTAHS